MTAATRDPLKGTPRNWTTVMGKAYRTLSSPCQGDSRAGDSIFHRLLDRRRLAAVAIALLAWTAAALVVAEPAHAVLKIDIRKGRIEPLSIAVPQFAPRSPKSQRYAKQIADVIQKDLAGSGLFSPLPRRSFLSKTAVGVDVTPNFKNWQLINAQAIVSGSTWIDEAGLLKVGIRLWDVAAEQQMVANQYTTKLEHWRRTAHLAADAIYERLTGEPGYFDSRVVYIDETGPKNRRIKRLAIMDQDGSNQQILTDGKQLVLTPRYSPVADEITFMSYVGNEPRVYIFNLETGEQTLVGKFPGMTYAPRFSGNGKQIIMSLQDGKSADIFVFDRKSGKARRLTKSSAINTAPSFSPDSKRVVFESDRGGGQQLYTMRTDGSGQKRISFGQGSYATPVYSPDGKWIAFTKLLKGLFYIGIMRPDGTRERLLTKGFHNEGPTWAPNSQLLMFFRETPGAKGGPEVYAVDLTGRRERQIPTPNFASDPAWSPGIGQ